MRQGRRTAFVIVVTAAFLSPGALAAAEPRIIDLAIRDGELPKEKQLVQVRQGDDVTLRWTTDKPLTVHLHGYDIEIKLAPGPPKSTRFTARATGRFAIEVHAHKGVEERTLGYLEVHPR